MAAADAPTSVPAPICTHANRGTESDVLAVAAVHLAYVATFESSVYVRAAFLASGTVIALHKDERAASEERVKSRGEYAHLVSAPCWCAWSPPTLSCRQTGFLSRMMPP
eukprot:jgi/Tetstr1/434974/TSEL_023965.t1